MFVLAPLIGTGSEDEPFRVDGARQIIDLRPDARVVDGWALALLENGTPVPSGALVLSDADVGPDAAAQTLSGNIRNQLSSRLGLTIPNTTLGSIVAEILLSGDDRPLGTRTRWRPLRASRLRKRHEIWLGGLLWQQPIIAGGATLTETWTGISDGTTINGDHNWTKVQEGGGAGTWHIDTERLGMAVESETNNVARAEADLDGVDHEVSASVNFAYVSGSTLNRGGVCGRFSASADTWYGCWASPRNALAPWLVKSVASTLTTLASTANTVSVPATYTIAIIIDGSSLTGQVTGFSDLETTDTDITAGTRWGADGRTRSVANVHYWDNFTAEDLGAGALDITPAAVTVNATPGTLTVAPGAVDITPGAVTVNATPGTLSLALNATLTGPTVGVTPGTVTVTTGAVDITPDPTTVTVTPGSLTVANAGAGAQEITPGTVSVTATPGTLTVTTGAVDITPDPVTVTATPGNLTISQGAVDITPDPVTITATPGTLTLDLAVSLTAPTVTVTPGTLAVGQGIVVFPDAVTVTATPGTLTLSTGAVDITPDPVTVTATPGILAVGLAVEVEAPTVTVTTGTLTVAAGATGITPQPVTVQATPGVLVLTGGDTADPYPYRLTYRRRQTRLTYREAQ
jgi:hypothetical protein